MFAVIRSSAVAERLRNIPRHWKFCRVLMSN